MIPERDRPRGRDSDVSHTPSLRLRPSARRVSPTATASVPAARLVSVSVLAALLAVIIVALSLWAETTSAADAMVTTSFPAEVTPGPFATPQVTPMPIRYSTRIRFPYLKIDNAIVKSPPWGGWPYCGVAMYTPAFRQPGQGGLTFIFAHARVGMFWPILTASRINNGAALIGKPVYVYTTDRWMWRYTITRVFRHQTSLKLLQTITGEALILQTSEGPFASSPKVMLLGRLVDKSRVTYAASHPAYRIIHCK